MSCIDIESVDGGDSVQATLHSAPQAAGAIDKTTLLALLADSPYAAFQVDENAVAQMVKAAAKAGRDKHFSLPYQCTLARRQDASLQLTISRDELLVNAVITAAYGGNAITPQEITQQLNAFEVTHGVDQIAIQQLLQQASSAAPGEKVSAVIALGKAVVHGDHGYWVADVETFTEQCRKPRQREDGSVDMLDFGAIESIEPGRQLMHRQPPTLGVDGFTVKGKVLEAVPGSPVTFTPAKGVELSQDGEVIVATQKGVAIRQPGGIAVDDLLTLGEVSLNTGHIEFDGTVLVKGDVQEGIKIHASGDVTVKGQVHFAQIEAGGDITVKGGVFGHQHEDDRHHLVSDYAHCALRSQGSITLNFAQYALIEAKVGVQVERHLLHCQLETAGHLRLGSAQEMKSKLVGGLTRVGGSVEGANFGTEAFIPTKIEAGAHIEALSDQLRQLNGELEEKRSLLAELIRLQPQLKALPASPARQDKLRKLGNTLRQLKLQVMELMEREHQLQAEQQESLSTICVVARGTIFPNVNVVLAGKALKITQPHQGGGICYRERKVIYDPELQSL